MDVFFPFPGRVWIVFYLSLYPNRQRTLPGKSRLSFLEPSALILNLPFECQYFFFCFSGMIPGAPVGMRNEVLRGSGCAAILGTPELCCLR